MLDGMMFYLIYLPIMSKGSRIVRVRELSNEFPKSLAFMVGVLFGFPKILMSSSGGHILSEL